MGRLAPRRSPYGRVVDSQIRIVRLSVPAGTDRARSRSGPARSHARDLRRQWRTRQSPKFVHDARVCQSGRGGVTAACPFVGGTRLLSPKSNAQGTAPRMQWRNQSPPRGRDPAAARVSCLAAQAGKSRPMGTAYSEIHSNETAVKPRKASTMRNTYSEIHSNI